MLSAYFKGGVHMSKCQLRLRVRLQHAVAVLALGLLSHSATWAAAFQNGSFETVNPATVLPHPLFLVGNTNITGWTVVGGNINYINDYWSAADGTRSIDLNGWGVPAGTGSVGGVSQTFDTEAGHTYQVSFAMSGNFENGVGISKSMSVLATGGSAQTYVYDIPLDQDYDDMHWINLVYTFTATGTSTTLTFSSLNTGTNYGPVLDNVVVQDITTVTTTPTPVAVPTLSPWALGLLSGGLLALAGLGRRKRRR
jgi:choice-of-anchor C domain-containing protein